MIGDTIETQTTGPLAGAEVVESAKPPARPKRDQPEEVLARLRERYPEGFARALAEVGK